MAELLFPRYRTEMLARGIFNQLETAFIRSKIWEFEKPLGHGSYGVTALLRDRNPLRLRSLRRVVLKRALVPGRGYEDLQNEIEGLDVRTTSFSTLKNFSLPDQQQGN
jgi:hypothetical protein